MRSTHVNNVNWSLKQQCGQGNGEFKLCLKSVVKVQAKQVEKPNKYFGQQVTLFWFWQNFKNIEGILKSKLQRMKKVCERIILIPHSPTLNRKLCKKVDFLLKILKAQIEIIVRHCCKICVNYPLFQKARQKLFFFPKNNLSQ